MYMYLFTSNQDGGKKRDQIYIPVSNNLKNKNKNK